jgi:hypothetical protein
MAQSLIKYSDIFAFFTVYQSRRGSVSIRTTLRAGRLVNLGATPASVQTGSGAHRGSSSKGTVASFQRYKAAGA